MLKRYRRSIPIAVVWAPVTVLTAVLVTLSVWPAVGERTMGLLGIVLGAVLTSAVTYTNHWFRSDDRLRTAQMC
ncbi:MAG: hypothetical protein ACREMY_21565, partial [bacterium]